jgi:formyl-CoA transferase
MASALEGIRVIDLTQWEAGPSCTETLAWLGADVIKIEEPRNGEASRRSGSDQAGVDSHYFIVLNANKKSVGLDLRNPKGKELLLKLVETADVFIENFGPGTIERLGLDYETLSALNPRLIYAQIKGYHPQGPYGKYLSFDRVAQAVGGAMSYTGIPTGGPLCAGPTLSDEVSGLHTTIGILAALNQRVNTGRGQKVRISMQEATINVCRVAFGITLETGEAAPRKGNGFAMNTAPSDIYRCKPFGPNDFIMIYTSRNPVPTHWHRVLDAVGRPDLKGDPRFETVAARAENAVEIDKMISAWTSTVTKEEAMRALGDTGVPAGAVFDTWELLHDEALRADGMFASIDHAERGEMMIPASPIRLSDSHVEVTRPPNLGEHTRAILEQDAGVSDADWAELVKLGVV